MNPVTGINFGRGQIRYDVDAMKQVAGEFLEVIHFADAIDLGNDSIQDALDFLVGALAEKCALAFQAGLMPKEFLAIEL
jgi:hypothetical protein